MNKQSVSIRTSLAFLRAGFTFLFLASLSTAFAYGTADGYEPFVNIQYARSTEAKARFQVDVINDSQEALVLTILEQDGTVLYKEKVSGKAFTKTYEWYNAEALPSKLLFSVQGEKSKKVQTFEVNTQVRIVQDVKIQKRAS